MPLRPGESLLSEQAIRLLHLLTPEPTPLTESQRYKPATLELERAGLVVFEGYEETRTIRLSLEGRRWRHSLNN